MDENGTFARLYAEKRRERAARERDAQREQRREARRESANEYQQRRGSMPRRAMTTLTKEIT